MLIDGSSHESLVDGMDEPSAERGVGVLGDLLVGLLGGALSGLLDRLGDVVGALLDGIHGDCGWGFVWFG